MQARYYDPVIGRFLSHDPVQFSVEQPLMFNRYGYTFSNPINAVDPDGEFPINLLPNIAKKANIDRELTDARSETRLQALSPYIQTPIRRTINSFETKTGKTLRITDGFRSDAEQNAIYQIGRDANGNIIGPVNTHARGGESYHNYGLAVDVQEISNGSMNWSPTLTQQTEIGNIGKAFGLEWGGDFQRFTDLPHLQLSMGLTTSQLANGGTMFHDVTRDGNGVVTSITIKPIPEIVENVVGLIP